LGFFCLSAPHDGIQGGLVVLPDYLV
jgi:hypothetical protein